LESGDYPEGSAIEVLNHNGGYYTLLVARVRIGVVEITRL